MVQQHSIVWWRARARKINKIIINQPFFFFFCFVSPIGCFDEKKRIIDKQELCNHVHIQARAITFFGTSTLKCRGRILNRSRKIGRFAWKSYGPRYFIRDVRAKSYEKRDAQVPKTYSFEITSARTRFQRDPIAGQIWTVFDESSYRVKLAPHEVVLIRYIYVLRAHAYDENVYSWGKVDYTYNINR